MMMRSQQPHTVMSAERGDVHCDGVSAGATRNNFHQRTMPALPIPGCSRGVKPPVCRAVTWRWRSLTPDALFDETPNRWQ